MEKRHPNLIKIGKKIRELRKKRGYSQEGFAAAAQLGRSYAGRVERGEQNISMQSLIQIALTLEIDVFNSLLEQVGYMELEAIVAFDTVNKMKGVLNNNIRKEWHRILNPLTWLSFVLKIPFLLLKQTGFNVDKIENELWGKLIKIVCLILLLWMMLRLGFTKEQITNFLKFK